jgi:hypothetical protein
VRLGSRHVLAVAAASAVLLATVTAAAWDPGRAPAGPCRGLLAPAYVDAAALSAAFGRGPAGKAERLVVANPHNGPGAALDPAYAEAIRRLRGAGVRVLGYVATGYGRREPADALADVRRFREWYAVDGVFLDEASSEAADVDRYREVAQAARAAGSEIVVLNPGRVPAPDYFDLADLVVTFEGTVADYAAAVRAMPAWVDPERSAHLVYGASRAQALELLASIPGASHVYVTDGRLPNPWAPLSRHLRELERALDASCGG